MNNGKARMSIRDFSGSLTSKESHGYVCTLIVEINCEWIKFNMSELDIKNKIKFSKSSIFNSKDGLKLNKDLVLNIGLYEAFFLSILFDESKNETNVWFELTMERVINNYNISRHKQDEAIKNIS